VSVSFTAQLNKLNEKYCTENYDKGSRIAKMILEKQNKVGVLTLSGFKT
jgi:hypothetical protein